ncbi:capsule assembly Wzi family protein [Vibrio sp.]|nr:capsule assembly Wzi family protein [Vibrio sp.]
MRPLSKYPISSFYSRASIITLGTLFSTTSFAQPWIEPNDIHLRSDIQYLASTGVITTPVTTYPLMWSGIISSIESNKSQAQSEHEQAAIQRIEKKYQASQTSTTTASVGISSEPTRFHHFDTPVREEGQLQASHANHSTLWAYKAAVTAYQDPSDEEDIRFTDSYVAFLPGNWVISAGYQKQWSGPGWDTTLLQSTNAHPLPGISLTRNNPEAFDIPVLKWLGPWTLTTTVSRMDDERHIDNALLWTTRASFRPHKNLEIGAGRSAQLCGDDKDCGLSAWSDTFSGDTNVTSGENPANQIGHVDLRWSDTAWETPYSVYFESAGEDAIRLERYPPFQAKSYIFGLDTSYALADQWITTFVEYSETMATCNSVFNCTYEHSAYKTGYRYHSRTIGSTYDNDANTYTLGFIGQSLTRDHQWRMNVRYLELNKDDSNTNTQYGGGNSIAPIAENAYNIDASYAFPALQGTVELGVDYMTSEYTSASDDDQFTFWSNVSWVL